MNIAFVAHYVARGHGEGRVNYEVVRELLRRDHHLTLVATDVAPELAEHPRVQWVEVSTGSWPTQLLRDAAMAWRSARWMRRHAGRFDAVLTCGFVTWISSTINIVQFVHSAWRRVAPPPTHARRGPYAWYQWTHSTLHAYAEQWALRNARAVVAISEQVRGDLVQHAGVSPNKISVFYNGVDLDEFQPGTADRAALGLPEDVPLAFFVGDIRTSRKNLGTVLQALQRAPGVHLAVAGGTERSPYPAMSRRLGVGERVHFLGYRSDVPQLMRAVDLLAFPSRYEPFGLVVLEAMASGLPVVTARTAGIAELITEDTGVVLEDPDDAEQLAAALRTLVAAPERRGAMGRAARTLAEKYTWQHMAEQYAHLLEDRVVAPAPAGGPAERAEARPSRHAAEA